MNFFQKNIGAPQNINFLSESKRKAPDARRHKESIALYETMLTRDYEADEALQPGTTEKEFLEAPYIN
jgi:hypothetical protein